MSSNAWLDLSQNANCFKASYVAGFLDQSGSDTLVRSGNFSMTGLKNGAGYINQSADPTIGSQSGNVYLTTNELNIIYAKPANPFFPINVTVQGNTYIGNDVSSTCSIFTRLDASFNRKLFFGNALVGNRLYVLSDASINGRLFLGSDASLGSRLFVPSDLSVNGRLFALGDASLGGGLFVSSDVALNGRLFIGSDASLGGRLFFSYDV